MTEPSPVENHPCVVCGKLDDHPMIHALAIPVNEYGIPSPRATDDTADSYHFDCYPFKVPDEHTAKVVEKAKSGTHGDELRKYIQKTAPKVEG